MPLHDPWIVADAKAGLYRLYTSNIEAVSGTPGLGTMMYVSRDLKAWSPAKAVFVAPTDAWFKDGTCGAEVHQWRGRWWLFTTFHDEAAACRPSTGARPIDGARWWPWPIIPKARSSWSATASRWRPRA